MSSSNNPSEQQAQANQTSQANQGVRSKTIVTEKGALLETAIVNVILTSGKTIPVRALIDKGSESSLIKQQLAKQLGIVQEPQDIPIKGVGDVIIQRNTSLVRIQISSSIDPTFKLEVEAYTIDKVYADLPSKQIERKNWPQLNGLKLTDNYFEKTSSIDLLLGIEVYEQIILDGIIKKINDSPTAMNSRLGWLLFGKVNAETVAPRINCFHVNMQEDSLNELIKSFWQLEEVQQRRKLTVKEQQAEDYFRSTVKRNESGRYQVSLPFDQSKSSQQLGESRVAALHCLYRMEKRFSTNQTLKERYHDYIQNLLNSGHLELVPYDRIGISTRNKFNLSHHTVMKESSLTTKLRVVFNASKKSTTGISLNDKLLIGPTIQDELFEILIRWRIHFIAFIADIEKMHRQIQLEPEHRDYQRILWRFSPNQPILEYRITTVIDGTASATFLATRTLRQTAIDYENKFPEAARVVKKDFYMDDVSSGSHNVKSAIKLEDDLISLIKAGLRRFHTSKVVFKQSRVLENIPLENGHDPNAIVELVDSSIKTLGVHWNQKSDCFEFKVVLSKIQPKVTKREVLSDIAKLFDPIGWLYPAIVVAKIFIQSLWIIKDLDWDKHLPQEKYTECMEYRSKLPSLESIKIARWIGVTEICKIEIHGFCDASNKAYASVVFTRVEYIDGAIQVNNITGKTKVAPIKVISTPKLELCGCVLLSNLVNKVKKSFNFNDVETFLYSDSTVCLAWITSHPNHWNVFVANRITEIQQLTNTISWQFVDTNHNPADCASRGVSPDELQDHPLWWHGPSWLSKNKNEWPKHRAEKYETELEKRKIVLSFQVKTQQADCHMDKVLKSFSELFKLQKITSTKVDSTPGK